MRLVSAAVTTISLSAFLAGCGGGNSSGSSSATTAVASNSRPTVASAVTDQSGQVGYELTFDATQNGTTFADADGDTLTYSVTFSQDIGLTATAGVISGTPNQTGDITVTVQASDPVGENVSDSFTLSIGIKQDAIVAVFGANIDLVNMDNYIGAP